jgi:membrane protease YdiL (CAAX protease family)
MVGAVPEVAGRRPRRSTPAGDGRGPSPAARALVALQIVALYVLPVLAIVAGAVPAAYRYWVFGVGMTVPLAEMVVARWSPRRLGLRLDNLAPRLGPYAAFTAALVAGSLLLAWLLGRSPAGHPLDRWDPALAAGIVALSLAQEVCFRGYLLAKLGVVFDRAAPKILANAALFAWMHAIYPDPLLSVAVTFPVGLGFAAMFVRYPNLWLAGASHAVLNCVGTAYCFVNLGAACAA